MREIEAKLKVKSLKLIARKLRQLGAGFLYTVREQDLYLDAVDNRLLKSNSGLRLRKRMFQKSKLPPQIYLTWKGPTGKSAYKSRHEIQAEVDNYNAAKTILFQLGFKSHLTVNKLRQIWKLGKCEICLDKVQKLGNFIEVEGPTEKAISTVLDKLKLDKTKHLPSGYARMLAAK